MELKSFFAQDDQGNKLAGATCYVYQRGSETLVEGLLKANGVSLPNPFVTDVNGLAQLAAPNGLYDVRVVSGSRDYRITLQFNDVTEMVKAAEDAARQSESARDSANFNVGRKNSIAEGLRETVSGQSFTVLAPDARDYIVEYKNNNGVAIEVKKYPSADAIKEISDNFDQIAQRNGILFGVWDLANRLGLDLTTGGKLNIGNFKDVVGHILALEAKSFQDRNDRSGNLLSITDLADALALAIESDGSLIVKGRNILKELDAIKSGAANNKWITPSGDIMTWGDSMSENNWQKFLRELMPDRSIISGGVGGQKSGQIARRQGGVAPMVTIANNTIPASGGVSVSVDVPFMFNAQVVYGRLYGVNGTLSHVNSVLTFTRSQPGVAVQIDEVTPFILDQSEGYDFRTTVFWAGNNDDKAGFRPQIDGNVTRMVDFLKPQEKRFFVIGMAVADYSDRLKGTPYYSDTMALHQKWRERWPDNFIDITPLLQRHYDPNNPTDVQNLLDGCTPSSLRVDNIHLNDAGWRIVANHIHELLKQRGW